jgi:hypothetical protein
MPVPYPESESEPRVANNDAQPGSPTRKLEPLIQISFSRYPVELRDALQNGRLLVPVWDRLKNAGYSHVLNSGAKVVCAVNQYEAVCACVNANPDVRPYHVLVAQSYRDILFKTIWQLCRSRRGVRVKHETVVGAVPSAGGSSDQSSRSMAADDWVSPDSSSPQDCSSDDSQKGMSGSTPPSGDSDSAPTSQKGAEPSRRKADGSHNGESVKTESTETCQIPTSSSDQGLTHSSLEMGVARSNENGSSQHGSAKSQTTTASSRSPKQEREKAVQDAGAQMETVYLISFSRYPVELRCVLQNGPLVVPIRQALRAAGYSYEMRTGAKLYCGADQHDAVCEIVGNSDVDVRPYHVIFTESSRQNVLDTIGQLRRALKVRVKQEIELGQVKASKCVLPAAIPSGVDSKKGGQGACKGATYDDGKSSKGGLQGPPGLDAIGGGPPPQDGKRTKVAKGSKDTAKDGAPLVRNGKAEFVQTVGQNMPDTFSGKGVKGKDGHGKRVDVKGSKGSSGKLDFAAPLAAASNQPPADSRVAAQLAKQLAGILEGQSDPQGTLTNSFMEGLDMMLQVYRASKAQGPTQPAPPIGSLPQSMPRAERVPVTQDMLQWLGPGTPGYVSGRLPTVPPTPWPGTNYTDPHSAFQPSRREFM